ncbi:flagellar biosynthetic protein FliO [Lichenicoccus sp.]|uniref:flagellar biosynthetic protein FliO n=1 Tax=Lichenicoccus sp. TaxID=2781899 RepID=UPI003D09F41D
MRIHDILTVGAALGGVIGMILLARFGSGFAGRLTGRRRADGVLSLDASLSLDPKRRLCLVGVRGQQVLLLTGGSSDVLLGWLPPAAKASAEEQDG